MDDLFKRIETGHQYVAYAVTFRDNRSIKYLLSNILFDDEGDARIYMHVIYKWYKDTYTFDVAMLSLYASVTSEVIVFDGLLVHSMKGRAWKFDALQKNMNAFRKWKTSMSGIALDLGQQHREALADAMEFKFPTYKKSNSNSGVLARLCRWFRC